MSAIHPKADIGERNWDVRFVAEADSCSAARKLLVHLVGNREQRRALGRAAINFLPLHRIKWRSVGCQMQCTSRRTEALACRQKRLPDNLVITTPQARYPESAIKVSKTSVATRVSPKP
jgi:hypothetical protein